MATLATLLTSTASMGEEVRRMKGDAHQTGSAKLPTCRCGNIYMPDSVFCRKCGAKRLCDPVGGFEVLLERKVGDESLGMILQPVECEALQILQIASLAPDGLISAWNAEHAETPERQLLPEDIIVQVNGVSNDHKSMLEKLTEDSSVCMLVQRGRSAKSDDAGASQTGSSSALLEADVKEGDFEIRITRKGVGGVDSLGLGCDCSPYDYLLIRHVAHNGLMADWNEKVKKDAPKRLLQSKPAQQQVKAGDRILAVNEVSGRGGEKALQVLKTATELVVTVRPCRSLRPSIYEHAHGYHRAETSSDVLSSVDASDVPLLTTPDDTIKRAEKESRGGLFSWFRCSCRCENDDEVEAFDAIAAITEAEPCHSSAAIDHFSAAISHPPQLP